MWKVHVTSGDGTVAQTLNLPERYLDFLVSNILLFYTYTEAFSTHSDIHDGFFFAKTVNVNTVNYFRKKAPS